MNSRFFTCSVPGCERPSVRAIGGCDMCNRYMCLIHMSPSFHKCSKILDDATYKMQTAAEIERLRSQINDVAVCKHASSLNGGQSCTIEYSSTIGPGALMGSANYHARIRFPRWFSFMVTSSSTCY